MSDSYGGDIYELTKVMVQLAELKESNSKSCTASNAGDFSELVLNSTSNLLSSVKKEAWLELLPGYQSEAATRLLVAMEGSYEVLAKATKNPGSIGRTAPGIEELKIDVNNVSVTELQTSTVAFNTSDVFLEISQEDLAIQAHGYLCNDGLGRAVFILYNDVAQWLKITPENDDQAKNIAVDYDYMYENDSYFKPIIITKVVSASIISDKEHSVKLRNPVRFTLRHKSHPPNSSSLSCVFWSFSKVDFVGHWSSEGCKVVSSNEYNTTCECDHLTNLAVLMSAANKLLIAHHRIDTLNVLTSVGCSISVCALVLTIVIYAVTWNDVKSHQAAVLLNLCVSLIAANTIFMAGINKVDRRIGCAAIAALLHYFFLAAFFIMLVEGIQLLIYVVFVFRTRRKLQTASLLVAAWVLPLIILAISLGITKADGYGTKTACWLSITNNLIWAFLGPVLVIMIVNAIIIVIVLVKLYKRRLSSSKNDNKAKIRGIIWNIAVITPLLGLTWLLGFFIDYSPIIEYIFTVVNSLQGLFIFVFHALFQNKKFNTRLSSLAARYMCSNCNSKQQTGSKDDTKKATTDLTFINPPSCSKESQINSFSDADEKQTTSIDNSSAFMITSYDKSSSDTVEIASTVL